MRHLTGIKQVLAIASAIFLIAAASGTALAMLDPGQMSLHSKSVQQQIQQSAASQAQQSPLPTPTHVPEPQGGISFHGTLEVIASTGWVISGRTVQVTGDTMVEVGVDVGSLVKVHAQRQADGSLVATQIELIQNVGGNDNGNVNSNDNENDNGNVNSNDDHGDSNENENDDHDDGNVNSNDNGHHDAGNVNSNDAGSHDGNHEHNGNGGNDQYHSHAIHSRNGNSRGDHGGGN